MSRLTAFFLTLIISYPAFYNAGLLGYWLANRAYITSALCENRDRPQLHCDGKCYLKKKLETGENTAAKTQKLPELKKGMELAECTIHSMPALVFVVEESASRLFLSIGRFASGFSERVFHPPCF